MKDLNPQQKAAAAKRKLGPSSLLAFWKRPVTGYITSTSLPGKGIPYWSSSSMPLFIPLTQPFAQCAAHGCVPLTINTQINTLVFSCKICWRVQRPKITQEKNDTPQPHSDLTVPDLISCEWSPVPATHLCRWCPTFMLRGQDGAIFRVQLGTLDVLADYL